MGGLGLGVEEQRLGDLTWTWQDGQVLLQWPATMGPIEIDVLDALGRIVQPTQRYAGSAMQASIAVDQPGTYLARWRGAGKQHVIRFVRP